jgi:membrane protein implicated in regulation of membrane protease activity
MLKKDTSKSRFHSATTYKLYIISCVILTSGLVLMMKFPEMHSLAPEIDPLSLKVYGLSIKFWKIIHILSALLFVIFTALHMYFNREWIQKVGSKKLNLNVTIGILIGLLIILAGVVAPPA